MSLNEVDWAGVLADRSSFPPDLEVEVRSRDPACTIPCQRFLCHRLLLSVASPALLRLLAGHEGDKLLLLDTNPEAFHKIIEFIYHKKPFKVHNGGLCSSATFIKLVLDVLGLAVRFQLEKLVAFCEDVAEQKILVTSANSCEVQAILLSNPNVTERARCNIFLKYKSVARRQLARSGAAPTGGNVESHLRAEIQRFAEGRPYQSESPVAPSGGLSTTLPSLPCSTAFSTAHSSSLPSSSPWHVPFSPLMTSSPQASDSSTGASPPRPDHAPSPLRPDRNPSPPHQPALSLASSAFLGLPSSPAQAGNLRFDAYSDTEVEAPAAAPRVISQEEVLVMEKEVLGELFPPPKELVPEDLLALVANFGNLPREQQVRLVDYVKLKETTDPALVAELKKRLEERST